MFDWKELTMNAVIGYGLSWAYFFTTLSFFQARFGKYRGPFINYWISWGVWASATAFLQLYNPGG
jgi:hypothetical protein